jgi:hypothetical protein
LRTAVPDRPPPPQQLTEVRSVAISRRVAMHGRCLLPCPTRIGFLACIGGHSLPPSPLFSQFRPTGSNTRCRAQICRQDAALASLARSYLCDRKSDSIHIWLLCSISFFFCSIPHPLVCRSARDPNLRLVVRLTNTSTMFDQALAHFGG